MKRQREKSHIGLILKRAHTLQMDDNGCLVLLSNRPAAQSFLILERNRKGNKQKKINNKGICRVKASSFVALVSLSVETFLQKRIPWSRYAETADPIIPSNIEGACVYVECDVAYCCTTLMAPQLDFPGVGD